MGFLEIPTDSEGFLRVLGSPSGQIGILMNYGSHIGITGSLLETRESQFYPGRILSEFLGFTSEFVGIPSEEIIWIL